MSAATVRIQSDRTAVNQANAQHSTGPRTPAGKKRSSMNSLRHGLTALSPVLPTEDRAAYDRHLQEFLAEYQPKTATETQLSRDLADTAWRLNRVPALEAALLSEAADPANLDAALRSISTHGHRLSRQFHNTLDRLRIIQSERRQQERDDFGQCAAVYKVHKDKGLAYNPADDGFVFSSHQLQGYIEKQMRRGMARNMEWCLNSAPEKLVEAARVSRSVFHPRPDVA